MTFNRWGSPVRILEVMADGTFLCVRIADNTVRHYRRSEIRGDAVDRGESEIRDAIERIRETKHEKGEMTE